MNSDTAEPVPGMVGEHWDEVGDAVSDNPATKCWFIPESFAVVEGILCHIDQAPSVKSPDQIVGTGGVNYTGVGVLVSNYGRHSILRGSTNGGELARDVLTVFKANISVYPAILPSPGRGSLIGLADRAHEGIGDPCLIGPLIHAIRVVGDAHVRLRKGGVPGFESEFGLVKFGLGGHTIWIRCPTPESVLINFVPHIYDKRLGASENNAFNMQAKIEGVLVLKRTLEIGYG